MTMNQLDVMLLGKEYRVSCTPETRDELLATVAYLSDKFSDLSVKTNASGEKLAVIEAMKMENVLLAAQDGVVSKVLAGKGESLAVDQIILEFQ